MSNGDGLRVKSSQNGMNVQVGSGSGILAGGSYINDEAIGFQINVASAVQDRKDSIGLRMDTGARETYLYYKAGDTTVARNDTTFELQLATIDVAKNATQVSDANITDMRGNSSVCGWSTPFDNINVDGMVDQYKAIFEQGENDFLVWFDSMKDQLSTDAAGNLQNQVNDLKTKTNENTAELAGLLELVYPVGAYYFSSQPTEPATLFGFGTWERVKGRGLVGVDESDSALSSGGKQGGSTNPLSQHTIAPSSGQFVVARGGGNQHWSSGGAPTASYAMDTEKSRITVGDNTNHNNWQPFEAAYIWKRIA
ncbi:hypothetical protein RT41_GL000595 [Lactococcus fujiensis JCM 16395]|uniref:Baseplate structural protein Gp10 C-terminal domain-containing protein n=2 Tax=Lactococcus fujiensis TaxID=610251 RepID=A0A2A5RIM2_9LACT|nr:hypothetical protein RT41_GL000595 [Lactococcus fujiensis JCM 16395]